MQTVEVAEAAPVTPVEHVVAAETKRDGDRNGAIAGNESDHSATQGGRQIGEAGGGKNRVIVELGKGGGVESVQQRPFGRVDLVSMPRLKAQAAALDAPPLGLHLAPLGGAESRQIAVEIAAARIDPVKLHVVADQQTITLQQRRFVFGRQRHMPRRRAQAIGECSRAVDESLPDAGRRGSIGDEEARSGYRCVWQAGHQFRVVLAAELAIRRCP